MCSNNLSLPSICKNVQIKKGWFEDDIAFWQLFEQTGNTTWRDTAEDSPYLLLSC